MPDTSPTPSSAAPSAVSPAHPCAAAARVAAVCRRPEAVAVRARLRDSVPQPREADLLWLTWVQWRALGRDAMPGETGLSAWTVTERLRRLREAGAPVLSAAEERERIARGRFHGDWD